MADPASYRPSEIPQLPGVYRFYDAFRGGLVVAEGTPEDVAKVKASYTGQYLAPMLATNRKVAVKK